MPIAVASPAPSSTPNTTLMAAAEAYPPPPAEHGSHNAATPEEIGTAGEAAGLVRRRRHGSPRTHLRVCP